ncbi:MAG: hypothetical protein NTY19_19885 [Planctomycetota bacterium]|nr:hypothetical protein [Planctomycetota bacterium]
MLKLLAVAPEDGWAFVRTGESIWLVRPPYSRSNTSPVSERVLEKGVTRHGFSACERGFADWRELVEFLNEEVRKSREARGEQIVREGLGAQLLQFAPDDVLGRFLSRVETELLPAGSWEPAERLLIDMLRLPQVRQNPGILARVSDLLGRTVKARKDSEARGQNLFEDDDIVAQCPALKQRYNSDALVEFNRRVCRKGSVLLVGK